VVAPQKVSTRLIYDSHWKIFSQWCVENNIIPHLASVPQIADFLLHLFKEKKLTPKTIEGYRTAISSGLRFSSDTDIGKDTRLTALIHSFYQERPRPSSAAPPWDLSIVLHALASPPFEPIDDANKVSLQLLTWKTIFLVLLASGCRRGEVHALQYKRVLHDDKWKWVSLHPSETFISKTQLRTAGATALQPVTIRALSTTLDRDMTKDRALCPVRALKTYLARTQHLRKDKKLLFIAHKEGHSKDIHPNTISGWIRKLIHFVYANCDDSAAKFHGTSAHAIRGLAATLAFKGTAPVEDIMRACSWKSHNTFTSFYLKEVSGIMDELHKLGPLAVAQTVTK
jgi:integrase